jgi:RNA polymerase sigma factor FliA
VSSSCSAVCLRALTTGATAAAQAAASAPCHNGPANANPTSRDALVIEHLPLVRIIAAGIRATLPTFVDFDDLVQAGTLGLMDAAKKFSADKQTSFSGYAKHRIRGAILDSLREVDCASRDMRRWQKRVDAAINELSATLGRAPEEGEVAEKLGLDVERLRQISLEVRSLKRVSVSSGENDELPHFEFPTSPEMQPDSICSRKRLSRALVEAIETLPPRHQMVVRLYYVSEKSMKEIGATLGVNESRVSQIHRKAVGTLKQVLSAGKVTSSMS